mmetsp:Transcript_43952/g.96016  ORF Transcript_43952/g.96016 Transcript_43952/m.96016 type:complete len:107 (+) Transcript_43952:696-1016(+)
MDNWQKIPPEVSTVKLLFPQHLFAGVEIGIPAQYIKLMRRALTLHDNSKGGFTPLRRVRQPRRQHEHLTSTYMHIPFGALLNNWQDELSLKLPEKLGPVFNVEISA